MRRYVGKLARRTIGVLVQANGLAIERRRKYAYVRRAHGKAVLFELQVFGEARKQRARPMCKRGALKSGMDFFKPVKPETIAKSLAIGTPADGFYALRVMKDTGAAADDVTDDEIREGMKLLAECEGIFTETAGGVTVGVAKKLIASGKIPANDSVVLCITGNGLKTLDAVVGHVGRTREIRPSLREFEALLDQEMRLAVA